MLGLTSPLTCSFGYKIRVCLSLSLIQGSNTSASSNFFSACLTVAAETYLLKIYELNFLKTWNLNFCFYWILIWLDHCQTFWSTLEPNYLSFFPSLLKNGSSMFPLHFWSPPQDRETRRVKENPAPFFQIGYIVTCMFWGQVETCSAVWSIQINQRDTTTCGGRCKQLPFVFLWCYMKLGSKRKSLSLKAHLQCLFHELLWTGGNLNNEIK